MEVQESSKDTVQVAESNVAVKKEEATESFADYNEPPAATLAAIEFQIASLLDDRLSTVNWPGREPLVVNRPGDHTKKLGTLRRIAKAHFSSRGDRDDVLDQTIDEYGLWKWAHPSGFWTAFKRDMFDAAKAAYEAKRVSLGKVTRISSDRTRRESNSYEWTASTEVVDEQAAQKWLAEWRQQLHPNPVFSKWERAKASGSREDCQDYSIVRAICRVLADEVYMDELASTDRDAAKLTRLVAEIRSLTDCSQSEAYRLLADFKSRYSPAKKKVESNANFLRKTDHLARYVSGEKNERKTAP